VGTIPILMRMFLRNSDDRRKSLTAASAISDLLNLLHEEWLDEGRKTVVKTMLEDMIDRMEDNLSMDDLR